MATNLIQLTYLVRTDSGSQSVTNASASQEGFITRVLTAESVPKLAHDLLYVLSATILVFAFRVQIRELFTALTVLVSRIKSHSSGLLGTSEFLGHSKDNQGGPQSDAPEPEPAVRPTVQTGGGSPSLKNTIQPENVAPESPSPDTRIEKFQSAHYYWLGSDAMECFFHIATAGNKDAVERSLLQILHHSIKVGARTELIDARLRVLREWVMKTPLSEWQANQTRRPMLAELSSIRDAIGNLVNKNAGDGFDPWAKKDQDPGTQ